MKTSRIAISAPTKEQCNTVPVAFKPLLPREGETLKQQLERALPPNLKHWVNSSSLDFFESNGTWIVLVSESQGMMPILVEIVRNHLRTVCIEEQCSPFDERHLIEFLSLLSSDVEELAMVAQLKESVLQHINQADDLFDGDYYFHRRSNIEIVSFGGLG